MKPQKFLWEPKLGCQILQYATPSVGDISLILMAETLAGWLNSTKFSRILIRTNYVEKHHECTAKQNPSAMSMKKAF